MNINIRHIEPTAAEPETWIGFPALDTPNVWVEGETRQADFEERSPAGGGHRLWLGVVVVALAAGIALGGRLSGDATNGPRAGSAVEVTSASDLPFTITSPAAGATVKGATIDVSGTADEPVPVIHLAIVVGSAVIGWTTVQADRPGPWSASIPVFAPPVTVEAQLVASSVAPGSAVPRTVLQMQATASIRRDFSLRSGGPIGFWPATMGVSGATTVVSVGGSAPVGIGRVDIRLTGHDGRQLAATDAEVVVDDTRPGAIGGYSLGLGSFTAKLTVPGPIRESPIRVGVDWRDPIGGEWGTSVLTIIPATTDSSGLR